MSEGHSSLVFLQILGTLGLFAFGVRTVRDILQARAGKLFDWSLEVSEDYPGFIAPFMGMIVATLFQAPRSLALMLIGSVNAGLYPPLAARGLAFGLPWGAIVLGFILTLPFDGFALMISGPAALLWLSLEDKLLGRVGKALLGLSFIYLSFNLGQQLAGQAITEFTGFSAGYPLSVFVFAFFPFAISFIIRSQIFSPYVAILLSSLHSSWLVPSWLIVLGTSLGVSVSVYISSRETKVQARRVAQGMFLSQFIFTMVLIPFLPAIDSWAGESFPFQPEVVFVFGWLIFAVGAILFSSLGELVWNKVAAKSIPDSKLKEKNILKVLGRSSMMMPSTTLVQAEMANEKFSEIVSRMFTKTREYLDQEARVPRLLAKIKEYERITDNLQSENYQFLCALSQKELTEEQSKRVQSAVRIADELESIADYLNKLATGYTNVMQEGGLQVHEKHKLTDLFNEAHRFYQDVTLAMNEDGPVAYERWREESDQLRIRSEELRSEVVKRADRGDIPAGLSLAFSDMVVAVRKIRSHTHNIAQSLHRLS